MPDFVFFKKGNHLCVIEKSDTDKALKLKKQGYDKQFEEIDAPDSELARTRFLDIKDDEASTEYVFATGAAFIALIVVIMAVADFIFLK